MMENKFDNLETSDFQKSFNLNDLEVGLDLQNIKEIFPEKIDISKSKENLQEIFTLSELAYADSKKNITQTLAGIFAAKESIIKVKGKRPQNLNDIEINYDNNGKPFFENYRISISHSQDYVVAVAVKITSENEGEIQSQINSIENNYNNSKHNLFYYFLLILFAYLFLELIQFLLFI